MVLDDGICVCGYHDVLGGVVVTWQCRFILRICNIIPKYMLVESKD